MSPEWQEVIGFGCLGIAVLLLFFNRLRARQHPPEQRHALVASHMRTYEPRPHR